MGNRQFGRLLVACTRTHDWTHPPAGVAALLPAASDRNRLVEAACRHGVEACAHLSLRRVDALDGATRQELERAYFAALQSHARAKYDLAGAAAALDDAGIAWLAFKGPVLAETTYERPDLRSYSDLDLLVAPRQLQDAIGALGAHGAELLDRNWALARRRMAGEVHLRMPGGTVTDLHWNVCNDPAVRTTFNAPTDELLERVRFVDIDGRRIPTLGIEDALVHLAVHACVSGGTRLLWSKDLEQALRAEPVVWSALVARARAWRAGPPTAAMLHIASRTLGFDVPGSVLRALSPGPVWRVTVAMTRRVAPVEDWEGGASLVRDVCRSTRGNDRTSTVALGRRAVSLMRSGRRRGPHEPDRDPESPNSVLHPADDGDRVAYFAEVERAHG